VHGFPVHPSTWFIDRPELGWMIKATSRGISDLLVADAVMSVPCPLSTCAGKAWRVTRTISASFSPELDHTSCTPDCGKTAGVASIASLVADFIPSPRTGSTSTRVEAEVLPAVTDNRLFP
jgi:hypothetical protein